jgi:hypothetical protein
MTLHEFFVGLRQRNWTSKHFQAAARPWRLQLFRCGHNGPTAWTGWRGLVTEQDGSSRWAPFGAGRPGPTRRRIPGASGCASLRRWVCWC